jgi:hypothetical protein
MALEISATIYMTRLVESTKFNTIICAQYLDIFEEPKSLLPQRLYLSIGYFEI